jgi:hypothetical protein
MKKRILLLAVLAVFTAGSMMAQTESDAASGEKKKGKVGSLIKRVGEQTTGINMSDETFAVLPQGAQPLIQMEVVSCIGNSEAGTVLLTIAVKAKKNNVQTGLGKSCGNGNQECITGYDTKGNTYTGQEVGSFSQVSGYKENPAGIPVQYEFAFSSVPSTLNAIEVVNIEFYIVADKNIGSNMSGVEPIQIRNIPIQWGVTAE